MTDSGGKWQRKRQRVFERDGNKCVLCGRTDELTIDHIRPRSLGGTDRFENLRTLCGSCNVKKGADFHDPALVDSDLLPLLVIQIRKALLDHIRHHGPITQKGSVLAASRLAKLVRQMNLKSRNSQELARQVSELEAELAGRARWQENFTKEEGRMAQRARAAENILAKAFNDSDPTWREKARAHFGKYRRAISREIESKAS